MPALKPLIHACLLLLLVTTTRASAGDLQSSKGQTVYIPAYSHVFTGPRSSPYNLAITLVIRNTDQSSSIRLSAIDYLDTNGKKVRSFAPSPAILGPLSSSFIHLEEKDTSGGFAPKFILRWETPQKVTPPIIEAIMIGATSGQGISFTSQGRVIQER
jgi:hypothetical protein